MLNRINENRADHQPPGAGDERATVGVISMGCKVNRHDQALLEEQLVHLYGGQIKLLPKISRNTPHLDLVVVNTCTVTAQADRQGRKLIRSLHRQHPAALILVTGCGATVTPDQFTPLEGVVRVAGNPEKPQLARVIGQLLGIHREPGLGPTTSYGGTYLSEEVEQSPLPGPQQRAGLWQERTRPFLAIADGCDNQCTYCIIPKARGTVIRSISPYKVLDSLCALGSTGAQEVVLTGINLGKYGLDLTGPWPPAPPCPAGRSEEPLPPLEGILKGEQLTLAGLVQWLEGIKPVPRIRLSSIELPSIKGDLLNVIKDSSTICDHFHIPLQSGADSVLQRMGRTYTRGEYSRLIMEIHDLMPRAGLGTDVIVGFPGETDEEFEETRAFIESLPLSYLHVFPFSPREGTKAALMGPAPSHQITRERAGILRKLGEEKRKEFARRNTGHGVQVLIESYQQGKQRGDERPMTGFAGNYLPIILKAPARTGAQDTGGVKDHQLTTPPSPSLEQAGREAWEGKLIKAQVISTIGGYGIAVPCP